RIICAAVGALQILAGVVVIGLVGEVARRSFGWESGIAAATLSALYGPSAFFEADILGVVWGQLALVGGLLACVAWIRRPLARTLMLGGVAFGLAAVERPNLLLVVVMVALWIGVHAGGRRALTFVAALAVGVALPLAIVLALNVLGTGQWVPLTTSGGINFALGYHPGADGTYDEP